MVMLSAAVVHEGIFKVASTPVRLWPPFQGMMSHQAVSYTKPLDFLKKDFHAKRVRGSIFKNH